MRHHTFFIILHVCFIAGTAHSSNQQKNHKFAEHTANAFIWNKAIPAATFASIVHKNIQKNSMMLIPIQTMIQLPLIYTLGRIPYWTIEIVIEKSDTKVDS